MKTPELISLDRLIILGILSCSATLQEQASELYELLLVKDDGKIYKDAPNIFPVFADFIETAIFVMYQFQNPPNKDDDPIAGLTKLND